MASRSKIHDEIREEMDLLAKDHALEHLPPTVRMGKAFELWCLDLLGQWNRDLDVDPMDIPDSGDGGVDILLEDTTRDRFLIAQCAYVGKSGRFGIDKWKRLCQLAEDLVDEERMRGGGYGSGPETKEALVRVARRIGEGNASVDLFYITTAVATADHQRSAAMLREKLGDLGIDVQLWDQSTLKKIRSDVAAIEADSIDEIDLEIPAGQQFEVDCGSNAAYVVALKASAAAAAYDRYQQRLLAWNIRSYLGSNAINSSIRRTAEEDSDRFFLCNNGITAIARKIEPHKIGKHTILKCSKFQVINGGQTLASLAEVYRAPATRPILSDIPVLFTIIETRETSPTSPENQKIIQARNTQNKVLLSDFRSNDPIQSWLASHLEKCAASILPRAGLGDLEKCRRIFYKPKRDNRRKRGALKLQLEDLAKIRYAYLHEPWTVLAYVNQLWTRAGEETRSHPGKRSEGKHDATGKYEKAFGRPDERGKTWVVPKTWDDDELVQVVFAIVVHEFLTNRIREVLREIAAKEEREGLEKDERLPLTYLKRARFHMLSLAGEKYRDNSAKSIKKLFSEPKNLFGALERHWKLSLIVLKTTIHPRLDSVGRDAILRSPDLWNGVMLPQYRELDAL